MNDDEYEVDGDPCIESENGIRVICVVCDENMEVAFEDLEGIKFVCPSCEYEVVVEKVMKR